MCVFGKVISVVCEVFIECSYIIHIVHNGFELVLCIDVGKELVEEAEPFFLFGCFDYLFLLIPFC